VLTHALYGTGLSFHGGVHWIVIAMVVM